MKCFQVYSAPRSTVQVKCFVPDFMDNGHLSLWNMRPSYRTGSCRISSLSVLLNFQSIVSTPCDAQVGADDRLGEAGKTWDDTGFPSWARGVYSLISEVLTGSAWCQTLFGDIRMVMEPKHPHWVVAKSLVLIEALCSLLIVWHWTSYLTSCASFSWSAVETAWEKSVWSV